MGCGGWVMGVEDGGRPGWRWCVHGGGLAGGGEEGGGGEGVGGGGCGWGLGGRGWCVDGGWGVVEG